MKKLALITALVFISFSAHAEDKTYDLKVTSQEANTILLQIEEMKIKDGYSLFQKLAAQINEQNKPVSPPSVEK